MLKKEFRLRRQKDFDRVFGNKGSFFSHEYLSLKLVSNSFPYSRFGFIVSNKISKKAVNRNRIKRLLREAIRLTWDDVAVGFDAVIMVKTDISDKKMQDVDKVVDSLLKKSGILVKK
jgi:ribonuclease P protein component